MSTLQFPPPSSSPERVLSTLRDQGFAVLDAPAVSAWLGHAHGELAALSPLWDDLPPDAYLKDGGRYRSRRHQSCVLRHGQLEAVAHRAHWQSLDYNALHGGMERWFEPVLPALLQQAVWPALLLKLGELTSALKGERDWYVEAHQFRIDTTDGIGRPTPEGAHRDGVDLVAVFMVGRHGIKGGETRVFEAQGPLGQRFTLTQPWSLLLLDDARVIHESTPIQPDPAGVLGWRDTLVVTLRARCFPEND